MVGVAFEACFFEDIIYAFFSCSQNGVPAGLADSPDLLRIRCYL